MDAKQEFTTSAKSIGSKIKSLLKLKGIDASAANEIALCVVFPNRGRVADYEIEKDLRITIQHLPYNLALEILDRQDRKMRNGDNLYNFSEKQMNVISQFDNELARVIRIEKLFAPKSENLATRWTRKAGRAQFKMF
jgi:hypothetical protein